MKVHVFETAQEIALAGADLVVDAFARARAQGRAPVFGVATGSSPQGVYQELISRRERGELKVSDIEMFSLDEYLGLVLDHPSSYRTELRRNLTEPIGIPLDHLHTPPAQMPDVNEAAEAYEAEILAAGGIDIQILGLGSNGHIAFNEPGSAFESRTRREPLSESTRRDNARFFDGDLSAVPTESLTQGIATIMAARSILLIAIGAGKAEAVAQLLHAEPSPQWPVTALQRHPEATVLLDRAAASQVR